MRTMVVRRTVIGASVILVTATVTHSQSQSSVFVPSIPRAWDDAALSTLEVPLPDRDYSPKAVSSDYYYRMPVRPIFKTYPVYVPGKEPKDYLTSLRQVAPEIVWDDKGHRPTLETKADWIKAGELVFDAAIFYDDVATAADVQDPAWHEHVRPLSTPQGVLPNTSYVIRTPGKVELGNNACSFCHTRVMPDGTVIKGAQGNFPFDRAVAYATRRRNINDARTGFRALFAAPWLKDADPAARVAAMTLEELVTKFDAVPPGVAARHRASIDSPPAIPDLIGIRERRYLDRTGLVNHRDIGDLMRYAALNNELDFFSRFGDFIPAGTDFRELPPPTDPGVGPNGRYSDEQLYALALYLYSLKPPVNPNPQTPQTVRGEQVFQREQCGRCHPPPLYTNDKLMPVRGFAVPEGDRERFAIMPTAIGTDPTLTLRTRRGTGYYKVPSLRGVWYRGPFEHNGSVATLEDWFDPRRIDDDYLPTGFRVAGAKSRPVPGHVIGLDLSDADKAALIAFLKTL